MEIIELKDHRKGFKIITGPTTIGLVVRGMRGNYGSVSVHATPYELSSSFR